MGAELAQPPSLPSVHRLVVIGVVADQHLRPVGRHRVERRAPVLGLEGELPPPARLDRDGDAQTRVAQAGDRRVTEPRVDQRARLAGRHPPVIDRAHQGVRDQGLRRAGTRDVALGGLALDAEEGA